MIRAHRGAFEYDWRTRFHLPLDAIGEDMSWGEACRLFRILRSDPASQVSVSIEGWDHPISREALVLFDLYDLTVAANSSGKGKRPKPHGGRPFAMEAKQMQTYGNTGGRSRAEVVEILNKLGHNLPV